jgi:hypothetical protein
MRLLLKELEANIIARSLTKPLTLIRVGSTNDAEGTKRCSQLDVDVVAQP